MVVKSGTPRTGDFVVKLDGKPYHVRTDDRGARSWAVQRVTDQDVGPEQEFNLPIPNFANGAGFTFEGIPGTYDRANKWEASGPGKLSTWGRRATGASFTSADARGWQFTLGNYLYVCRGRYVQKYAVDDTKNAVWPIIESHDLGSGNVVGGRIAIFNGAALVPIRSGALGAAQRFHQLSSVNATITVEVQTVAISGGPTGGTYLLTFDGKSTANIAWDASGATVQAALRLIAGLEQVTVSTAGGSPNFTHTVTMTGAPGALATTSPPQMTNTNNLTGGVPVVTNATTVAGLVDRWDLGPAGEEAVCFLTQRDAVVRANTNVVSKCLANPLVGGDWGPEYLVGNTTAPITDLAVHGLSLVVLKTDGVWTFDETNNTTQELPDLAAVLDDLNGLGAELSQGVVYIPHKLGLIRWDPGSDYQFVGAEQEGALEGDVSRGWGRVQSIAPYGQVAWYVVNDLTHNSAALMSLRPRSADRSPVVPHMHREEASAFYESAIVLSQKSEPPTARNAAAASDDAAVGTITWASPSSAIGADNAYATAAVGTSHYLKLLNFGPGVPTGATVTGILIQVERSGAV